MISVKEVEDGFRLYRDLLKEKLPEEWEAAVKAIIIYGRVAQSHELATEAVEKIRVMKKQEIVLADDTSITAQTSRAHLQGSIQALAYIVERLGWKHGDSRPASSGGTPVNESTAETARS